LTWGISYLFEALTAVGLLALHEVALSAEQLIAVEARKVGHVPAATLRLRAPPRLVELRVVTTTVHLFVFKSIIIKTITF